jgi:hypothetical protein
MSDFHYRTKPKARKNHICEWCGKFIITGEKHVRDVGACSGEFYSMPMHSVCAEQHDFAFTILDESGCNDVYMNTLIEAWYDYQRDNGIEPKLGE